MVSAAETIADQEVARPESLEIGLSQHASLGLVANYPSLGIGMAYATDKAGISYVEDNMPIVLQGAEQMARFNGSMLSAFIVSFAIARGATVLDKAPVRVKTMAAAAGTAAVTLANVFMERRFGLSSGELSFWDVANGFGGSALGASLVSVRGSDGTK